MIYFLVIKRTSKQKSNRKIAWQTPSTNKLTNQQRTLYSKLTEWVYILLKFSWDIL